MEKPQLGCGFSLNNRVSPTGGGQPALNDIFVDEIGLRWMRDFPFAGNCMLLNGPAIVRRDAKTGPRAAAG